MTESARSRADVDLDNVAEATVIRHDPTLASFIFGAWCNCSCGWESGLYSTVGGAHLAFGQHLLGEAR